MKILHAPVNYSEQPHILVSALRKRGLDARQLEYVRPGMGRGLGFRQEEAVPMPLAGPARLKAQTRVLESVLEEGYDIYHFWQRSLLFRKEGGSYTGRDLPVLSSLGATVVHRFTGFDLRLKSEDLKRNPYSPYRYGFESPFPEDAQRRYIDFLKEHVSAFVVQDPEMGQFMPEAEMVPRALDLAEWEAAPLLPSDCPLVVHAPTNALTKGTRFIRKAVEELKSEGLRFDFRLIENMPHDQARALYRKADVVVDQILIGATGVLTLEAWALGRPVVCYLREDLFRPFYGDMPVANASPDTVKDVLRRVITDFPLRSELAAKGRAAVKKYHDAAVVAASCEAFYRRLAGRSAPADMDVRTAFSALKTELASCATRPSFQDRLEELVLHLPGPLRQTAFRLRAPLLNVYRKLRRIAGL